MDLLKTTNTLIMIYNNNNNNIFSRISLNYDIQIEKYSMNMNYILRHRIRENSQIFLLINDIF